MRIGSYVQHMSRIRMRAMDDDAIPPWPGRNWRHCRQRRISNDYILARKI
jgi:hypothetical protein